MSFLAVSARLSVRVRGKYEDLLNIARLAMEGDFSWRTTVVRSVASLRFLKANGIRYRQATNLCKPS